MYLLNTTFVIQSAVFGNWKKFIKTVYIPLSLNELKFDDVQIMKIHTEQEGGDLTYSVQFKTPHLEYIQFYQKEIQPRMLRELSKVFNETVLPFSTVLQEVQLDG